MNAPTNPTDVPLDGGTPTVDDVRDYWEREVCGTRLGDTFDDYDALKATEYHITGELAEFEQWAGRRVLEVGVGGGSDFLRFARAGADLTGVDLTAAAVDMVRRRLTEEGLSADVRQGNGESLPFDDGSFDLVYSYGVLHHSADPVAAFREVFRVLKPGGEFRGMVYSDRSACGFFVWAANGLLKGRPFLSQREVIYRHLESPGTKSYGNEEFRGILRDVGFEVTRLYKRAGSGDLLLMPASEKYAGGVRGLIYGIATRIVPRNWIRRNEERLGMGLNFVARRPD